jgi:amicyanin
MNKKGVVRKSKKTLGNKISITLGIIVVLLLVWAVLHYYWQPAKPLAEQQVLTVDRMVNVEIKNLAFNPEEVTIKAGESVVWINNDDMPHSIVFDSGIELSSPQFVKREIYGHQFNETGTYSYHCGIHRYMKGKIIVE